MVCKLKNQRQSLLAVIALSVMLMMTSCVTVGEEMHSTPEFKGKIARSYEDSQEWWPDPKEPPEGAPNVIIFLLDDVGFAQIGSFEIGRASCRERVFVGV